MKETKEQNSKNKIPNTNKGITLIALVITIIVMLILVAVTITVTVNGGLFEYASRAARETNHAIEAEQTLANGRIQIGQTWYDSVGDYIKNQPSVYQTKDVPPSIDELQSKYQFEYYSELSLAVSDSNNSTMDNADSDKENAVAGIYVDNGIYHVVLLKNYTHSGRITLSANMTVNLGGNTLTFENDYIGLQGDKNKSNTITIDGRLKNSKIVLNGVDGAGYAISTGTNNFIINGGTYNVFENAHCENYKASVIYVSSGGSAIINNCEIVGINSYEGEPKYNAGIVGIINAGSATVSNSSIKAYSHDNLVATSIGMVNVTGPLTVNDCYVFGVHSGIQNMGALYVDGGTYESYRHGGFYFSGSGTTSYVKNATIRECDMPDGYIANVNTNNAGFYIGGSTGIDNVTVYMDSCEIYGSTQPIILRGTDGEQNNTLYISNSKINTDQKIRIDNDTHRLYIGIGNNFTADNTTRPSSVTQTTETYIQE